MNTHETEFWDSHDNCYTVTFTIHDGQPEIITGDPATSQEGIEPYVEATEVEPVEGKCMWLLFTIYLARDGFSYMELWGTHEELIKDQFNEDFNLKRWAEEQKEKAI